MIKIILEALKQIDQSGWLISDVITESEELFFVKKNLDMNRGKKVHHINVTLYKDTEENGTKFKGSSTTKISPTMSAEEVKEALEVAALAASFVKNQHYDLVEKQDYTFTSDIKKIDINKLVEAVYRYDTHENGGINSSEFFIETQTRRLLNSNGVDVSFESQNCLVELVTDWNEGKEEVELYEMLKFAYMDYDELADKVKNMIEETHQRAIAKPLKSIGDVPVVLTGESVTSMVEYFMMRPNYQANYQGFFDTKVGDKLQGDIQGDALNITLRGKLENSTMSAPCDGDGFILKDTQIIKNGEVVSGYGSKRFASYLGVEPTGNFSNIDVEAGTLTKEDLKKPHVELISFSDFQTNPLTGDFGGEIRLARYFDGEKYIPYFGGAITGNMRNIQSDLRLSEEINQINNFRGPKYIQFDKYSLVTN